MRKALFFILFLYFSGTPYSVGADSIDSLKNELILGKLNLADQALAIFNIGEKYFHEKGIIDRAELYYLKGNKVFNKLGNKELEAKSFIALGALYSKKEDEIKVLDVAYKAREIYKKIGNQRGVVQSYSVESTVGPIKERIKTLRKAHLISQEIQDSAMIALVLNNMGANFFESKSTDSALHYFKEAIAFCKPESNVQAYGFYNIGEIYREEKKYILAHNYMQKALRLFTERNARPYIGWVIPEIVELNLRWQKDKPEEFKRYVGKANTLALLKRAKDISQDSKDYKFILNLNQAYAQYYKGVGKKDSVIAYQEKILTLKDSIANTERIKANAEFSEELKTADKEKEIIKLNADKKIASATANRNKIIFFLILLSLLSSIYFIVKRIKYKNQKEQEERDKNFRSKLSSDLHDDVGTILTSLSMQSELLEMKASEGNKKTVSKIAGMSRDATRRMRDTVWAIDSRKDNIMDLAYRMIDFAEDILEPKEVEFQLQHNIEGKDDKISAELRQNIFLLFKEAVTNAAKYGTGNLVTAALKKENEKLNLSISNQIDSKINTQEASGLGLSNMKKRAEDLNGTFTADQNGEEFNLQLSFPL